MPTERRMATDGRMVEVFIPEQGDDYDQFVAANEARWAPTPWYDMFGQMNTGDPKVELARGMAAKRNEEANAQLDATARMDSPRWIYGAEEQPDSIEAIDRELFQPIRRKYGVPETNAPSMTPAQTEAAALARDKFERLKTLPPKLGTDSYVIFSEKLEEDQPYTPAIQAMPAEKRVGAFGWDWLAKDKPAVEGQPEKPFRAAGTYTRRIPIGTMDSGTAFSPATNMPAAVGGYVIGRTYKGGLKYLGGDPKVEASWEKTQ